MKDGQLSQEEIDALLGNTDSNKADPGEKTPDVLKEQSNLESDGNQDSGEPSSMNETMSDLESDVLGEIGNISFGSAATALSTILNQKVEITTPTVRVVNRDALGDEFPVPHVSVNVNYTQGFQGSCLLVIKSSDASVIANLMMGGDGTHPSSEISEMEMSAVQEAMNQMMGSSSTAMSTVFNRRIDISPPQLTLMDVKTRRGIEFLPSDQVMFEISFKLKIGNLVNSNIMQLVPLKFGKELVGVLMHTTNDGETAAATETATGQQDLLGDAKPIKKTQVRQAQTTPEIKSESGSQESAAGGSTASNNIVSQAHVQPAEFSSFTSGPDQESHKEKEPRNLDLLMDIPLDVSVELGHTRKTVREVLELGPGSIIELDKLAGEAIDILINKKYVAKGEVVVVDENFGIRITEILNHADRLKSL